VDERVSGSGGLPAGLGVSSPGIQPQVVHAALAREQPQFGDAWRQLSLDGGEQAGAKSLALPVGDNGQTTDLRNALRGLGDACARSGY